MARFFALVSFLVLVFPHAASATEVKLPLFHSYIGSDALGKRFNAFLTALFARDFREVSERRQSLFDIYITTMDPAVGEAQTRKNLRTAYSFALSGKVTKADTAFNVYVESGVGICPGDRLEDCAIDLYDHIGDLVEQFLKTNPPPR